MALYYVDFENVHTGGLNGIEELCRKDEVYIYCRETDVKGIESKLKQKKIKALVKCKIVDGVTKNALDFELLSDLFVSKKHDIRIIISKDKGFDAAIRRGIRYKILCLRREFIGQCEFPLFLEDYGVGVKERIIKWKTESLVQLDKKV